MLAIISLLSNKSFVVSFPFSATTKETLQRFIILKKNSIHAEKVAPNGRKEVEQLSTLRAFKYGYLLIIIVQTDKWVKFLHISASTFPKHQQSESSLLYVTLRYFC